MYLFLVFFFLGFMSLLLSAEVFISFLIVLLLVYIGSMDLMGDSTKEVLAMNQSYECGFEYGMGGCGFSLQFYVVGFSFLLFDLEICLFTPLILSINIGSGALYFSVVFLLVVFFIYLYEVMLGAFNW
uniref:NADH-ubiquinone oxidoreductase chain 3 n=1 Tax=Polycarpa mytiligera TaxID=569436 RepID=S0DF53_POLMY|nr:NADH dehydrogenase subunit 3 [Polycarpa mytiligera]CCO25744.1 NADH dehydrogenase subunit 3 [Polycarpa mytiligera]